MKKIIQKAKRLEDRNLLHLGLKELGFENKTDKPLYQQHKKHARFERKAKDNAPTLSLDYRIVKNQYMIEINTIPPNTSDRFRTPELYRRDQVLEILKQYMQVKDWL